MSSFKERLYPPAGLRVLVTGAASGIGATIAAAFLEMDAKVHVCDIDEAALATFQQRFPCSQITRADVGNEQQVASVLERQAEFGGLDVLVNCAGIAGPTAGIDGIAERDWKRTIDVNLNGQYYFLHHAVPMLRKSDSRNIICISSVAGRLGLPWRTPYAATKWAIVGIVKSLAIELGSEDIGAVSDEPPYTCPSPDGRSIVFATDRYGHPGHAFRAFDRGDIFGKGRPVDQRATEIGQVGDVAEWQLGGGGQEVVAHPLPHRVRDEGA